MPLNSLNTSAKLRLLMLLEEVLMVELLIEHRVQLLRLLNLLLRWWREHQPTRLRRELLIAELVMLRCRTIIQERSLIKVVQNLRPSLPLTRPRQRNPIVPLNLPVIRQLPRPSLPSLQRGQIQQHQRHHRIPVMPSTGDIYRHPPPKSVSPNHSNKARQISKFSLIAATAADQLSHRKL